MTPSSIKVYARLKKERKLKEKWYDIESKNERHQDIVFHKVGNENKYCSINFRFCQIFDQGNDQSKIFETVARPIINRVLQGFNGTIFAYGQTGSGKTYTMTGSQKVYEDRGIIPRSLQSIFTAIEKIEEKPTLYISYMEIYNEICYDLLNPKESKSASRLEELPRVVVLEDKKGEARFKNLSVIPVNTEEEAMRLLFLGDTNRAIAETPLNEYSSRSHCIFTIYVTSRPCDTQTYKYSKLNLVDLAGSERVHKSHITGSILNEAKHINLSLHFLQQVILALSESKRVHIPYRNSVMTFILKDSLAGNCLTAMLATVAVTRENILETISTCKFAQRVSMIKTEPVINEVSDPYKEILFLRNEVHELRKQLADRNKPELRLDNHSLTNIQKEECEKRIEAYLGNSETFFKLDLTPKMLQHCFSLLKNKIQILLENPKQKNTDVEHDESNRSKSSDRNHKEIQYEPSTTCWPSSVNQEEKLDKNCEEIQYYTDNLSHTYKKAKILISTIEECQTNIAYIKEKLDLVAKAGCTQQKSSLGRELEYYQKIYKQSLVQLKELKLETLHFEAGLKKAKAQLLFHKPIHHMENSAINKLRYSESNCNEYSKMSLDCVFGNRLNSRCSNPVNRYVENDPDDLTCSECCLDEFYNFPNNDCNVVHPKNRDYCSGNACAGISHSFNDNGYRDKPLSNVHCSCYNNIHDMPYIVDHGVNTDPVYSEPCFKPCDCDQEVFFSRKKLVDSLSFCSHSNLKSSNPESYSDTKKSTFNKKQVLSTGNVSTASSYCEFNYHRPSTETEDFDFRPVLSKEAEEKLQDFNRKEYTCLRSNDKDGGSEVMHFLSTKHSGQYADTQVVPNKLDKETVKAHSLRNIESDESALINFHSPKGQDTPYNIIPNVNNDHRDVKSSLYNDLKPATDESVNTEHDILVRDKNSKKNVDLFLETDTDEFREFMKSISLTGDDEVDREICSFYRDKLCL